MSMYQWPYAVKSMSTREIVKAVRNDAWQEFRKRLKGLTTGKKLEMLECYRVRCLQDSRNHTLSRDQEVRIDNYINALLRGGQLIREDGEIVVKL